MSTRIIIDVITSHRGGLNGIKPIITTGDVNGNRLKNIDTPPVGLLIIGCKLIIANMSGIVMGSINWLVSS